MLDTITKRLFVRPPNETLYHYTSLAGMLGIIESGVLRASDIRYMNDSAELRHTLDLMVNQVTRRLVAGTDNPTLLNQLLDWLSHRIVGGPLLFGVSFRANGNLLSQWRGYSVHGKGVSLGFNPAHIASCASEPGFQLARCIYDSGEQIKLIEQIIDAIEQLAGKLGPDSNGSSWSKVFSKAEGDILRIAAVLKHPSFAEEEEWRLVSPVMDIGDAIQFREGSSMLIPFYAFELRDRVSGRIKLDHVYLGPTSNAELSIKSIDLFLSHSRASPARGISYCQIPYRQR
jgi:hypothetical protein